jgi:transcriptional regulator with XRE-family HTH domain
VTTKVFKERLEKELNAADFPTDPSGRKKAFAKVFGVSLPTAHAILYGSSLPKAEILEQIASELEVSIAWLLGKE